MSSASLLDPRVIEVARFIRQQGGLRGTLVGERVPLERYLEERFYIIETQQPIKLFPHQRVILRLAFGVTAPLTRPPQTVIFSTIKKSGKTTIASGVARHITETWGPFAEVYCMANDRLQAQARIYNGLLKSLALTPGYDRGHRVLPIIGTSEIEWKTVERETTHVPTGGLVRAVPVDAAGEAGSNPVGTLWSELWGYTSASAQKMFTELTPVPTRARSIRWIDTYAGYKDEPGVLLDMWELATDPKLGAVRLRCDVVPDWPNLDECDCAFHKGPGLPLFINPNARLFAYIDQGKTARRLPWQQGQLGDEYYAEQFTTLSEAEYLRLHENQWTSSVDSFLPIEWYDACKDDTQPMYDGLDDHLMVDEQGVLRPSDPRAGLPNGGRTPCVLSIDAAVSNDCIAMALTHRNTRDTTRAHTGWARVWYPPKGGKFDYGSVGGLKDTIRYMCKNYNVVQVAYDPYQLHDVATEMTREGVAWFREFSQGIPRAEADKQLHNMIRDKSWSWNFKNPETADQVRTHFQNAGKKQSLTEDTKFRIVKKAPNSKIDSTIAISMGVAETMRLDLA